MKAPKLLPWIAKRAGVHEAVALKLWRRATGEAAMIVGNHDSSDFFRLSIERFISLVETEAGRCPLTGSNVTWMWRHQARIASLSLTAAESTYRLWRNNWENFVSNQKKAA
ncbi:MAG: hypothetical protein IPL58_08945 [Betaproteobacteria bacterium]|jgi:hypothetical protein|uniref:Uncharacterized protein n=1 Tax=Candidatus Proximibacter danicus TaxID=2954365 RepID=A0A9D7PRK2_9PROT|nr:hypothetical protein [Candidatus Proximibacter danicus]MBK9445420.1 hypothetical protein [Betaproteobacteria bacterium]